MNDLTYDDIRLNSEVNTYLKMGNDYLGVLGYTEHYQAHSAIVAKTAGDILQALGFDAREVELAKIAGYMHDLGNVINRVQHAFNGAGMAFNILTRLGMAPDEISLIVGAIGNHDEDAGMPVSAISAAIIIADKSDVRRSRVRSADTMKYDIHDRVNYAVDNVNLRLDSEKRLIFLEMTIDNEICPVMDYFEIFLSRMLMCRRGADFLDSNFRLTINGLRLL